MLKLLRLLPSRVCGNYAKSRDREREKKNEKLNKNYFRRKNSDPTSARVLMLRVLATADWRVRPRARASELRPYGSETVKWTSHERTTALDYGSSGAAALPRWCSPTTSEYWQTSRPARLLPSILLLLLLLLPIGRRGSSLSTDKILFCVHKIYSDTTE